MYVTLQEAKRFLNIMPEEKQDDELIIELIRAAEDACERAIDRPFAELVNLNYGKLPNGIIQAILLTVGVFFENRSSVSYGTPKEIPYTASFLLSQHKFYSVP